MKKDAAMKKIIASLILVLTLTSCSLDEMVSLIVTPNAPPPTAIDTATPTVFMTPSRTPTITLTPTFTTTPTPVGFGSEDPESAEVLPTLVLIPTTTSAPQVSLMSEPNSLILSLTLSSDILFWGYCDAPHYVDFDVRLGNNLRVTYVLLFMRLVDKGGNQSTAWGGGAIMKQVTGSHYTYRVRPENIEYYDEFKDAWIQYQVVVTTYGLRTLSRSQVYRENLTLKWCRPIEVDE